jgi:hypothetical protein
VGFPRWKQRLGGQVFEPNLYLSLFMLAAETEAADGSKLGRGAGL